MAMERLTLVTNPGSASRKYALFAGDSQRASLHFEYVGNNIAYTLQMTDEQFSETTSLKDLTKTTGHVLELLRKHKAILPKQQISRIGLRIVAPSGYFLEDHIVTDEVVEKLKAMQPRAPLHITASLNELAALRKVFGDIPIVGVSDSAFHATKPDYAWNYGLPLADADRFEIKRFGYHGLSVASVVQTLSKAHKHAGKVVVCHLGSGASITAVHNNKSLDTTMGYSPLEGLIMATRSGSIDFTAALALKAALGFNDTQLDEYLNKNSGLLGLGGSNDIRTLLQNEANGDHAARLALQTYVHAAQKGIGQMVAALGGIDALVFTGTVGERSTPIRERIVRGLHYLDLFLQDTNNKACANPQALTCINKLVHSKPIYVVPANEAAQIVRRANLAHN